MAMTKRDHEAMASLISTNLADVAIKESETVIDNVGLLAVTRIAIGYMNHAYATSRNFNGEKFIEWAGWVRGSRFTRGSPPVRPDGPPAPVRCTPSSSGSWRTAGKA